MARPQSHTAKWQICQYRQIIPATGGGSVTVGLFPTDEQIASIVCEVFRHYGLFGLHVFFQNSGKNAIYVFMDAVNI